MSINFKVKSTSLISITMMGFLIIQFITETKLPQYESSNIDLVTKQQFCFENIVNSNASFNIADILKINIELKHKITDEKLKYFNDKIIEKMRGSAMYALNASLSVGEINENKSKEIIDRIEKSSEKQLYEIYTRYNKIAATGTEKLQKEIDENTKKRLHIQTIKNSVWYLMFFLQFIGLILAIRSNGVKK